MRTRIAATAAAAALALVAGLAAVDAVPAARAGTSPAARAGTTALSTVYKTGTDTATGSTAASPGSPGSPSGTTGTTHPGDTIKWAPGGALTGPAHPGDTIKWVASYQNNTSQNASVNMTDPLTSAGAYVPGSLQLPADPIGGQSISPQYSADGGATWQAGPPPAGASGVGLTGAFPRARAGSASTSPPRRASRSPLPPATGTPWPGAGYVADSRW
jgi:hypothetical protein